MSPVAAPADRRFRRAHVKPVKRRQWRRRIGTTVKYAVLASAAAYAVHFATHGVAHARAIQIDHILVRGNERLSTAQVLASLQPMRGESLLWVNLGEWRQRLVALPWVRDAVFRRSLPSTIEVSITEREPMGLGRLGGRIFLVDGGGVIIDEYGPAYADLDLPIVDGLDADAAGGPDAVGQRAELAARVIAAVRRKPELAKRLSQVDVSDAHNAAVILTGDSAVLALGDDRFAARLDSYLELASTLRERVAGIDGVDLRFDNRIYVRPVGVAEQKLSAKPATAQAPAPRAKRRRH